MAKRTDGNRTIGIHETIMPNLHKACREHMLKKTADKIHNIHGCFSESTTSGFPVAEGYFPILNANDPVVRDGHAKDIGSKILQRRLGIADSLAIDYPVSGGSWGQIGGSWGQIFILDTSYFGSVF